MSRSAWGFGTDTVMDWRTDAACRGSTVPDAWFVTRADLSSANVMALKICRTCPVMDQCRSWYESLDPELRQSVIAGGIKWNSYGPPRRADA
jgi:hypothetical protein